MRSMVEGASPGLGARSALSTVVPTVPYPLSLRSGEGL